MIPPYKLPFKRLHGDVKALKPNDDVYPLGQPQGQLWHVPLAPGKLLKVVGERISFQSDDIMPGYSGGALFNDSGELVGMITEDKPTKSEAISFERIAEFLKDKGYIVPPGQPADRYKARLGWSGGGPDWCEFWVVVDNKTSKDVYVKKLELKRKGTNSKCALVPIFPELVPERPNIKADGSRQIAWFRINATQQELMPCEIVAEVTIIESEINPAEVESAQNSVVISSGVLGN
jgi:hypothetical protein